MADREVGRYGSDELAAQALAYCRAWGLSDPVTMARTAMGLVQRVTCADGTVAVLKCLSQIGRREEGTAPLVLNAFAGSGAVRLLRADEGAHLIEHCAGPQLLRWTNGYRDEVAMPILVDVVARLRRYAPKRPLGIPSLATRCEALDWALNHAAASDATPFRRARRIADDLLAAAPSTRMPALLHGDLHHENVLVGERPDGASWLAIDPQGVWGDPAYEVANLFGNPLGDPDVTLAKDRPVHLAATFERELGLPAASTLGWAYVHSCISAAWSIQDGGDPSFRLSVAKRIGDAL